MENQTNMTFFDNSSGTGNDVLSDIDILADDEVDQNLIFTKDKIINGAYIGIGLFGIVANGFVIFIFLASKEMRKFQQLTNIYLLNQSLLDFTVAILLVFLTLFENKEKKRLTGFGGELYCRFWLSKLPLWSFFVSSTSNLVVVNVERYLGIIHPIWHKIHFKSNMVIGSLIFIWAIGPIYNIGYMVPTSFIEDGECFFLVAWSLSSQRFVGIFTVVLQFFLPFAVHGYCGIRIVRFLHHRATAVGSLDSQPHAREIKNNENHGSIALAVSSGHNQQNLREQMKRDKALQIRNQVLKTLGLMTLCFLLCWVWNQVFFLLFNLGFEVSFEGGFYHFTVIAVYINCFTNPFIYVLKYKNFRDAAKRIFMKPLQATTSVFFGSQVTENTRY